jgi:hypothetical protein
LLAAGYKFAVDLVTQCQNEIDGFSAKEKKLYMLEKVRGCIIGSTKKGYFKFNWKIGILPGHTMDYVCRDCFCHTYGCGTTFIEVLITKLKIGEKNNDQNLGDAGPAINSVFVANLTAFAATKNIELSPLQIAALVIPNTVAALACFAWMHSYFDAVGDQQPNHAEIHLEPTDIKIVHSEYYQVLMMREKRYWNTDHF